MPSFRISAALALLVAASGSVRAEEGAKFDPESAELVQKFGDHLRGLKSFRVSLSSSMKVEAQGVKREVTTSSVLIVQRPKKAAMILKSGQMGNTIICDGETVYTYMPMMQCYTEQAAPRQLKDISGQMAFGMGSALPVTKFFVSDDPAKDLLEGVTEVRYVGAETLGDVACHRLHFEQDAFAWDAWLSAGDKPLILKMVPDFARIFARAAAESGTSQPKGFRCDMSYSLENWELEPELPADQFTFTPPAGVKKVDSFYGVGPLRVELEPSKQNGVPE